MQVTPLTTAAEVLLATGHDAFARATLRRATTAGWSAEGATAWFGEDAHGHTTHLHALGAPDAVGELLAEVLPELPPRVRVTVPRGTAGRLPAWVGLSGTDWDFRWAATPPPAQPGEERVTVLDDDDDEAVRALVGAASPTASVLPGAPDVVRWYGVPGPSGALLASAADTATVPGIGHVKSVAVHPGARGQGLGSAVTAAVTRRLLVQGCALVGLGMYADNAAGRALYDRLGFADEHRVTSGLLQVRSRW